MAGIALAPASDGSGAQHLYIVDRGVDNDFNPDENDGRFYEMAVTFPPLESAHSPIGSLDGVAVSGSTVSARGWTLDPDVPGTPISVHVYVDGRAVAAVAADGSRPDVGRVYPGAGDDHGFGWSATLVAGSHQVCA
ncbi:hypothetical protein ACQ1ZK_14310, partial [Enterococcus faecium]